MMDYLEDIRRLIDPLSDRLHIGSCARQADAHAVLVHASQLCLE